jgi:hypothetical protein
VHAHKFLNDTDKVLIEQDIVRPNTVTAKTNLAIIPEQRPFLVGSWLTCILWEPILRGATASTNIFTNEYYSTQARENCKLISDKLQSTIRRLFLESWPACMNSLLFMKNLGRIIKALELFELSSYIHELLPTSQEFTKFSNFVSSQLVLQMQQNRTERYSDFNSNIELYLSKFFQLINLSKESITGVTKVQLIIIILK